MARYSSFCNYYITLSPLCVSISEAHTELAHRDKAERGVIKRVKLYLIVM